MITPGFASVVIDVDSTLCGIEGIDWLAERRGAEVGRAVTQLTDSAMRGEIVLDAVYGKRLALVRPSADDLAALADAYRESIAPGAAQAIRRIRDARTRVVLVSGGLREAIVPVARDLGIPDADVHAVPVLHEASGAFLDYDDRSPLARSGGKPDVVETLELPRRVLAVGDGATDLELRRVTDAFAAFTGFVSRPAVVSAADGAIASFDQLVELVIA